MMKGVRFVLLVILLISCEKRGIYECVCYQTSNPSNYTKYVVKNTYTESYNNCKLLSNEKQTCWITE